MEKTKKYYPIDSYYSHQDDKLYYIVREVDLKNNTSKKISDYKDNPDYEVNLAKFTKKIKYITDVKEKEKTLKLKYKEYGYIKKKLEKVYSGNQDQRLLKKYPDIFSLNYDIYDDYKLETKFLQQDVFSYDDDYVNNIKMGVWDIEVFHDDKEFPNPIEAKYEINSITTIINNDITIFFLHNDYYHKGIDEFENKLYIKLKKEYGEIFNYKVHLYNLETDLLINFFDHIKQLDVIIGWNSLTFDTLYCYNRSKRLNIYQHFSNSFGEIFETMNVVDSKKGMMSKTFYTTKILNLDYINLIKFYDIVNYPSYSLNRIAQRVLTKEDLIQSKIEISNLNIEYLNNPINFINYNIGDVLLNKLIDEKMMFVKMLFKHKARVNGFPAYLLSINNVLDSYLMNMGKKYNYMCISPVKVKGYYTNKIWNIYRRINFLSDQRLEFIKSLREKHKSFSLFVTDDDLKDLDNKTFETIIEDVLDCDIEDYENKNINVNLSKAQFPFLWDDIKYPGAYVKSPKKGIYRNIIDFDAKALYPSCIYATNNSCDTWIYQIPENLALLFLYERDNFYKFIEENKNVNIEIYDVFNDELIKVNNNIIKVFENIIKKELVITEIGAVFIPAHIHEGFYRKLINLPISERDKVRAEKKKKELELPKGSSELINLEVNQLVDKRMANSIYGFLGYHRSRLFNVILASSITLFGQFLIRYTGMNSDKIVKEAKIS